MNEICSLLPADQDNFYKYNSTLSRPRVLLCLGFTLEGIEREGELLVDGRYADINVYSILKREVESWKFNI